MKMIRRIRDNRIAAQFNYSPLSKVYNRFYNGFLF